MQTHSSLTAPTLLADPATKSTSELRGIALLVGVSELELIKNGISPQRLVSELKARVAELLSTTEIETAAIGAIVPRGMTGSNIELTKLAIAKSLAATTVASPATIQIVRGLSVDYERRRVTVDGVIAELTCREFELLATLIRAEGTVMTREALVELASKCNEEAGLEPIQNIRSMDVYVRRLRVKLGDYADVVHTVRGLGYRFNRHADVKLLGLW